MTPEEMLDKIERILNATPTPEQMQEVTGRSILTYRSLISKSKNNAGKDNIGYEWHQLKCQTAQINKLLKDRK